MAVNALIKPSEYHDSVSLMLVARTLSGMAGVQAAAVVMATEANKSILGSAGLLTDQVEAATANDLVIVVSAKDVPLTEAALQKAEALLKPKATASETGEFKPRTIRGALSSHPDVKVAVISVAGQYAVDEAWDALRRGLHVLLFSDHVSIEDEIALKRYARDSNLLLMGPGAGTTILNNIALGFANVVPSGPVGIVSAAGTGLQEVSSLLARYGVGISQGIGVGGRDLSRRVGGIMMLAALNALQQDAATEVIALISKPPSEEVALEVLKQVSAGNKPTVVCFVGGDAEAISRVANAIPARTLLECAMQAKRAARYESRDIQALLDGENARLAERAQQLKARLGPAQKHLRGLFAGGTLCYEAQVIWRDMLGIPVHSNAPLHGMPALDDPLQSCGHTAVDLGEEVFTSGRPHPMIDNSLRIRRLLQEACDPDVAVIMLDVVLGYGAHPDPASELGQAAADAHEAARRDGRDLPVVASVIGTQNDPQGFSHSVSALERAGVLVCDSNAAAARLTALLVAS
jgi:succinyl-CoA synthetase alpha subunit